MSEACKQLVKNLSPHKQVGITSVLGQHISSVKHTIPILSLQPLLWQRPGRGLHGHVRTHLLVHAQARSLH